jgi:DNA polymerase III subunit epsilon
MKTTFTAIDFETAHPKRWSICQVGLVHVANGVIKHKTSLLVQPPDNFIWPSFTRIHGITPQQTAVAPTFDKIWELIKPFISNQQVVAHNAAFDFGCLAKTLDYYGIELPEFGKNCTYKLYGEGLAKLCKKYRIPLNHHDALSDALACAELYGRWLKEKR